MRRLLLLFLLLIPCSDSAAQEMSLDAMIDLIDAGRFVRLREIAEDELRNNRNSAIGNYLMGVAMYRGETNLPLARYYLERARALTSRENFFNEQNSLLLNVLFEMERVAREMEKYEEHLDIVNELVLISGIDVNVYMGWSLMKMGRHDEVRTLMGRYVNSDNPEIRFSALNTLGALEYMLKNYEESFHWFTVLKNDLADHNALDATALSNRAEAALPLLRFHEAESDLLLAARYFNPNSYSNPWQSLALRYTGGGRLSEGLSAVREMHQWSRKSNPTIEQQRLNEYRQVAAVVLMAIGYDDRTLEILREVRNRPDRRGVTSGSAEQAEINLLHLYREALQRRRERLREEAGWAGMGDWILTVRERLKIRREMWTVDRRMNALLLPRNRLSWVLRPYAPDSTAVEWLRPGLRGPLNNGQVQAELTRLLVRSDRTTDRERPYLEAALGETLMARTKHAAALPRLLFARTELPMEEVLLRARVEALIARAHERQKDAESAVVAYRNAMERDPGVLRALGLSLPVIFTDDGSAAARRTIRFLKKSPRFHRGRGFQLSVETDNGRLTARLSGMDGTTLMQVYVAIEDDSGPKTAARILCREIHNRAFAPKIDLSQADVNSLDGAATTGYAIDLFGIK